MRMTMEYDRPPRSRGPQPIGRIVSRLLARTGYDRERGSEAMLTAWAATVPGSLAAHSRPGEVRRGVLEVLVTHSAVAQEFAFHKPAVLAGLREKLPAAGITDLRCRVAAPRPEPPRGERHDP